MGLLSAERLAVEVEAPKASSTARAKSPSPAIQNRRDPLAGLIGESLVVMLVSKEKWRKQLKTEKLKHNGGITFSVRRIQGTFGNT